MFYRLSDIAKRRLPRISSLLVYLNPGGITLDVGLMMDFVLRTIEEAWMYCSARVKPSASI